MRNIFEAITLETAPLQEFSGAVAGGIASATELLVQNRIAIAVEFTAIGAAVSYLPGYFYLKAMKARRLADFPE